MSLWEKSFNANIKVTPLGGLAIKLINDTGETSVQGKLVDTRGSSERKVDLTPVGGPDSMGVILEAGVPDGLEMWVVITGVAEVLYAGSTTVGQFARMTVATDTGNAPGIAIAEAVPTEPFATDKHFQENGHLLETRSGAGLAKTVLHWN